MNELQINQIDKREIFINSDILFLKVLTEKDVNLSDWFSWFNDEETTKYMQQRYFPNTIKKQIDFYREYVENSNNKLQLGIVPKEYNSIVGVVSLSNIDFLNRKAEFGIIIGDKNFRGKGLGLQSTKLIIEHGFKKLSLNKIWLGVHSEHKKAIDSYKKAGFKIDALLREDIAFENRFVDTVIMSILSKDYFGNNGNE